MSQNSPFGGPLDKQHDKLAQTLLISWRQHIYHVYWKLWKQFSCKKILLGVCKILGLFVNTLTGNDKYSVLNRDNLTQRIHMQLSQKQKTLCYFFSSFLKSRLNFPYFQKKTMSLIAEILTKLRSPINVVRKMSQKSPFRVPLDKQHVKLAQTLLKSSRQHLYHIYW